MNQSRFYNSDRQNRSLPRTPSSCSSSPESASSTLLSETPLTSNSRQNSMASNISLFQEQMGTVLKKLDETNEKLHALTERIGLLEKSSSQETVEVEKRGKRKRTKDSLTIQEKVHKVHSKREERKQYKGLESVLSPHNQEVTAFIAKQLKSEGFDEIKVERASKKFHEHIRRNAQGKINDDLKHRMKMSNRKSRKYNQRKSSINDKKEREVKAFGSLTKEHMSSDEDDPENPKQWISRPPAYRSETLQNFFNKLDKSHEKKVQKDPKFVKRIARTVGARKEIDPPNATPLWAISKEWAQEKQAALEESNGVDENDEHEPEEEESDSSESEINFEL